MRNANRINTKSKSYSSSRSQTKLLNITFGAPTPLSMAILPTQEDVFKAYYERASNNSFDYNYSQCVEHISGQIISVYGKASLPIIEKESVKVKGKILVVRVRNLNKYLDEKKYEKLTK